AARGFAKSRGGRRFLVLTPCGFSNTNKLLPKKYPFYDPKVLAENSGDRIRFDVDGLVALLETLRERYGAKEKIGITGFSGGGNLCYAMTMGRPTRILFSAPACANFSGQGLRDAEPVEDGGPPIHILTGANDQHRDFTFGNRNSPGIEPQTDNAVQTLERLKFTNFKRTMLPGVGHSNCRKQVWDFADKVAGK
ncbi:MAG: alpha/beta hydrolase, partial [Planctomycetota bacterium]